MLRYGCALGLMSTADWLSSRRRASTFRIMAYSKNFKKFKPRRPERAGVSSGAQQLWGLHTVEEALRNPAREHLRLVATENAWRKLSQGVKTSLNPEIVRPQEIDKILGKDTVHQGVLLESKPLAAPELEDVHDGIVLALDQITDPHNVGAILRTAAAFDVKAVVMTERYSPQAQGVLAKSASGGLEHVPLIFVKNLRAAIKTAKQNAFTVVGLDSDGAEQLSNLKVQMPLFLVLGAEGKGLRHGVREDCDNLARIDMPGAIKSLNVSNAAALTLYIIAQK
jgi:23S rRNA (guanosine2251-2'-O)-methyltransferase